MRKIFKDTIEVKITLDTDDIKSICDNIAEVYPNQTKEFFSTIAIEEIARQYFDGYIWYNEDFSISELEEMFPNIIEAIEEYVDWYIIHYYLTEQEDFKWSDD